MGSHRLLRSGNSGSAGRHVQPCRASRHVAVACMVAASMVSDWRLPLLVIVDQGLNVWLQELSRDSSESYR